MNKLLIIDLKNTLVNETGIWNEGAWQFLDQISSKKYKILLYSMNEDWTYQVISRNPAKFSEFDYITLVNKKTESDFESFGASYDKVVVIGDSEQEELMFAKKRGFGAVRIENNDFNAEAILSLVEAYDE